MLPVRKPAQNRLFYCCFHSHITFFDYFYNGPPEVPMGLRASCHGHAVMLRVCARQVRAALPQNTTKPAPGPQGTCSTARNLTQMGFERLKMSQLIPPTSTAPAWHRESQYPWVSRAGEPFSCMDQEQSSPRSDLLLHPGLPFLPFNIIHTHVHVYIYNLYTKPFLIWLEKSFWATRWQHKTTFHQFALLLQEASLTGAKNPEL